MSKFDGGQLKKHNHYSGKLLFMWVIIPALTFFVALNGAYAYFSATANYIYSEVSTGSVRVVIQSSSLGYIDDAGEYTVDKSLVPGDTYGVKLELYNEGENDAYVLIVLTQTMTLKDGTQDEKDTFVKYYNTDGDEIDIENISATSCVTVLAAGETVEFSQSYYLDGEEYGNGYKEATVELVINIYSIQVRNITDAATATTLLKDFFLS